MSAFMPSDSGWDEQDPITGLAQTSAEVDVFKPDRVKAFIEAANRSPCFPPDHKKGAGGLIDFYRLCRSDRLAISPVHGVCRPNPIQAKHFEHERCGCRKSPNIEAVLDSSVFSDQHPTGSADTGLKHCLD